MTIDIILNQQSRQSPDNGHIIRRLRSASVISTSSRRFCQAVLLQAVLLPPQLFCFKRFLKSPLQVQVSHAGLAVHCAGCAGRGPAADEDRWRLRCP